MIRAITDITVDLYGEPQYYMVSAKQGDRATRFVRVRLTNGGKEFEIPEGVTLLANIQKPDGHFCYNECGLDGNRVLVELTNQALAAAGTAYCDVELRTSDGEEILSSAAFGIEIERSMRDEDAIVSCNEITVLEKKVQGYIEGFTDARQQVLNTEAEFKKAEAQRATAETRRATAETQRATAETNRQNAETQRAAAETQRQNAEQARAQAEAKRKQDMDAFSKTYGGVPEKVATLGTEVENIKETDASSAKYHLRFYVDTDGDLCQED